MQVGIRSAPILLSMSPRRLLGSPIFNGADGNAGRQAKNRRGRKAFHTSCKAAWPARSVRCRLSSQTRRARSRPRPCLAKRRLDRSDQRVPVEPDRTLAFAAADQYFETLHRDIDLKRLDPFDRDAHRVVATQIVELGAVFTLDRLDPQRLAPPVGSGAVSVRAVEGRQAFQRPVAQIIVIGMDTVAVPLQPAAHRAQERLHAVPCLALEQRT